MQVLKHTSISCSQFWILLASSCSWPGWYFVLVTRTPKGLRDLVCMYNLGCCHPFLCQPGSCFIISANQTLFHALVLKRVCRRRLMVLHCPEMGPSDCLQSLFGASAALMQWQMVRLAFQCHPDQGYQWQCREPSAYNVPRHQQVMRWMPWLA